MGPFIQVDQILTLNITLFKCYHVLTFDTGLQILKLTFDNGKFLHWKIEIFCIDTFENLTLNLFLGHTTLDPFQ